MKRRTPFVDRTSERGFTLVEVLIGIGIMSVVYLAVTQILVKVHLSHATMASTMSLRQEARVVLMRIGDEIRGAGSGVVAGMERLSYADSNEVRVALDLDRGSPSRPCLSEAGDDGVERVTYRVEGARVERRVQCWVSGAWQNEVPFFPVAVNVTAASFRYFDLAGNEVGGSGALNQAQRESVQTIEVTLALSDPDRAIEGEVTPSYQTSTVILLRNQADYLSRLVEGVP